MDTNWFLDINRFARETGWAHGFMKALAIYGVGLFAVLVLIAWRFARFGPNAPRAVAATLWAGAGTILAVGINQFIVAAVHRARPYDVLSGVEALVAKTHDFSFPSDHAISAGAATAGLWIISCYSPKATKWLAIIGTALALLVAFARIYVGAHYPSDVVAGLLIGATIMLIGWFAFRAVLTLLMKFVERLPLLRRLVVASHADERKLSQTGFDTVTSSRPSRLPYSGPGDTI